MHTQARSYSRGAALRKRNIKKTSSAWARHRPQKNSDQTRRTIVSARVAIQNFINFISLVTSWSQAMRFAAKVARALRSFMGMPGNEPLPAAVEMMNLAMGIVGEGALPKQVDALMTATGVSP